MSKLCLHHIDGRCRFGEECKKTHLEKKCRFWFCRGKCEREACGFSHELPDGIERPEPFPKPTRDRTKSSRKKNTQSFEASHEVPDMTVRFNETRIGAGDISILDGKFSDQTYKDLKNEIDSVKESQPDLLKLWHGDTHYIADDKMNWKASCPTFDKVVSQIADRFSMDVKATRFNWYADGYEWKPYHHDAAAVKKDKAATQNFTVGVSFGGTRDISFRHARGSATVNFPMADGMVYAFGKDMNIKWRHGVPQLPPSVAADALPRISIILWGWVEPTK